MNQDGSNTGIQREVLMSELGLTLTQWKQQLKLLQIENKSEYSDEEAGIIRVAMSSALALPGGDSGGSGSVAFGVDDPAALGAAIAGQQLEGLAGGYAQTMQAGVPEFVNFSRNLLGRLSGGGVATGGDPLDGMRQIFAQALGEAPSP